MNYLFMADPPAACKPKNDSDFDFDEWIQLSNSDDEQADTLMGATE